MYSSNSTLILGTYFSNFFGVSFCSVILANKRVNYYSYRTEIHTIRNYYVSRVD